MYKKFTPGICLVLMILVGGCANLKIPFWRKSSQQLESTGKSDRPAKETLIRNEYIYEGRIVNAQRLKEGRNLVIIPFKAGVGVEAGEELDKAALMVIKGISDAFSEDRTGKHAHFHVLTAENSNEADLTVKGHIVKMAKPSKIRRWVLLNKKKTLGVSGKIIDARTGETVLTFADHVESKAQSEDYKALGYRIGKNIGRFILFGV